MTRFALALTLVCALPFAAEAGSYDVTGQNGGTVDGTWTCGFVEGYFTCTSQSFVTGPDDQTGSRDRTTVFSDGTATITLTGTRFLGHNYERSSTWTRR